LKPQHQFVLESDIEPDAIIEIGKKISIIYKDVTAAFVTGDQIESYLIRGLQSNQVHVPHYFSIVGFDN
jgi:DNA-binding LacI/PurR family transcriptional regulator